MYEKIFSAYKISESLCEARLKATGLRGNAK
jgi:hypothetical protein